MCVTHDYVASPTSTAAVPIQLADSPLSHFSWLSSKRGLLSVAFMAVSAEPLLCLFSAIYRWSSLHQEWHNEFSQQSLLDRGKSSSSCLSRHSEQMSINVWAYMVDDVLVGHHVLPQGLTGNSYQYFLENVMPMLLEDFLLAVRTHVVCASPLLSITVSEFLDSTYPVWLIGNGGPAACHLP